MQQSLRHVPAVLLALLAFTGCTTVSLKQFYARADATAQIDIDPIGGFLLLYWVDSAGVVCHGAPGLTGQPGPAAITVAQTAALQDALDGAVITTTRLADYQTIPYTVGDYRKTGAGGDHFFQFDNLVWRLRTNGQGFRDTADHHYSVPQVIDVDTAPTMLTPLYAWRRADCDVSQFLMTPADVLQASGQHPTHCRAKAAPASGALTEATLFSYCVKKLPEGTRYQTY